MYTYSFNPLQKKLEDIAGDDLAVLRSVAEGWYVDYKRKGLEPREIGKHLAAFANQYGGWLFFGIVEANDKSRVAESFPGIDTTEIPNLSLKLREAAATHVAPAALYEERVIHGPCDSLGLEADKSILIVGVPQGVDPPYIHSSGRIYRRLADQSAPKEETDRHTLDLLWERGKTYRKKISRRILTSPELPEHQKGSSWAFIYLAPDVRLREPERRLTFQSFRNLVSTKHISTGPILLLPQVSSASLGYIGRQVIGNRPDLATPALRWWHTGIARFDIPLNVYPLKASAEFSSKYKNSRAFLDLMAKQQHDMSEICDLSMLVLATVALANLYLHLRREVGDSRPMFGAFELRNTFYKVPFFNSAKYVERCRTNGIPVIPDRNIVFPEEPYFDNMIELNQRTDEAQTDNVDALHDEPYVTMGPLIAFMLNALGVVPDLGEFSSDTALWENHGESRSDLT